MPKVADRTRKGRDGAERYMNKKNVERRIKKARKTAEAQIRKEKSQGLRSKYLGGGANKARKDVREMKDRR